MENITNNKTGLSYSDVKDIAREEAQKMSESIASQVQKNSAELARKIIKEHATEAVIEKIKEEVNALKKETRRRALIFGGILISVLGSSHG